MSARRPSLSGATEEEFLTNYARDDLYVDTQAWVNEQYGSTEAAVTALGGVVAARAEELSGVDSQAVRDRYVARRAAAEAQLNEATAAYETSRDQARAEYDRLADQRETARQRFESARSIPARNQDLAELRRLQMEHRNLVEATQQAEREYRAALDTPEHQELYDRYARAAEAYRAPDPERTRALSLLSQGYRDALAEVRDMGGEHPWHPNSKADAQAAFDEALEVYPTDWVEASASRRANPPVVRVKGTRAHYSESNVEKTRRRVPAMTVRESNSGDPRDLGYETPDVKVTLEYSPGDVDEQGQVVTSYRWHIYQYEAREMWAPESEAEIESAKPRGRGWERHDYTDFMGRDRVCWRRQKYSMKTVSESNVPELVTNNDGRSVEGRSGTYGVSVHELAHRFESTVPGVRELEEDFLTRRTTDPDTGQREDLVELYPAAGRKARTRSGDDPLPKTGEWARRDDLIDHYMGKEYAHGSREVMSTGTEGLFGGSFGGLVGLDGHGRADLDMRAFVLGTLASVGRADRWDVDPPVRKHREMGEHYATERAEDASRHVQRIRERLIRAGFDPDKDI